MNPTPLDPTIHVTIEQPDPVDLMANFMPIDLVLLVGVISGVVCLLGMVL